MSGNGNNKNINNYLLLCMCIGITFGMIYDKLALCLCIGIAIGAALDSSKK